MKLIGRQNMGGAGGKIILTRQNPIYNCSLAFGLMCHF